MRAKTGLLYLYLVAFSYCEEVKRTVTTPLVDSSNGFVTPDLQLVEYTGNTECEYTPQKHFVTYNGTTIEVKDPSAKNICDRNHFLKKAHAEIFSLDGLDKRFLPNPEILGFSVRILGYTVLQGSLTLAALATVGVLGATVAAIWYGSMQLKGDQNAPLAERSISSRIKRTRMFPRQDEGDAMEVCYADDPDTSHYVQAAIANYGMDAISNVASNCMQAVEDDTTDASGGLCAVELMGSDGSSYQAVIGGANFKEDLQDGVVLAPNCNFQSY